MAQAYSLATQAQEHAQKRRMDGCPFDEADAVTRNTVLLLVLVGIDAALILPMPGEAAMVPSAPPPRTQAPPPPLAKMSMADADKRTLRRAPACDSLGLGSARAAAKLLRSRPRSRWTRAVTSPAPKTLVWPVIDGRFGRGFGYVRDTWRDLRHDGVDIAAEKGYLVLAVDDGLVAYASDGVRGYGNLVLVLHGGGRVSVYAHLHTMRTKTCQRLARGQVLGTVGRTGRARGDHLHFQFHVNGHAIDPMPLFLDTPGYMAGAEARALRRRARRARSRARRRTRRRHRRTSP